ncbi:hypothetical protein [Roseospirillum parvum]|uniref:Uncharacterized protein n=1 Tax=Roseospirillum parvum TaxID=83401 RepID=A0A1G7UFQ8_9PROT|nr:hypothetical protein [Roseospirillum parvum]SDG46395.1 hypothetical protein SAMN05421742_101318 [Roseospirillum parvum]
MKLRLTLQGADYESRDLGRFPASRVGALFKGLDWAALRGEAARRAAAGEDFCPPGLYVEARTLFGQSLTLHLFTPHPDRPTFEALTRETFSDHLAGWAPRRPIPEQHAHYLDPGGAAELLKRFLDDLPDMLLQPSGYQGGFIALTRRAYVNSLKMIALIVALCGLVVAALTAALWARHPSLRPDWIDGQPWLTQALGRLGGWLGG